MDRSTARCFQAGSSLGLVTSGSADCREGRTWLDSTGERRDIVALDPLTDDVSEIVTFLRREYYSLTRVYGSGIARVTCAVNGNHDLPLSRALETLRECCAADFRRRNRGVPR